jgi:hypothetical protein
MAHTTSACHFCCLLPCFLGIPTMPQTAAGFDSEDASSTDPEMFMLLRHKHYSTSRNPLTASFYSPCVLLAARGHNYTTTSIYSHVVILMVSITYYPCLPPLLLLVLFVLYFSQCRRQQAQTQKTPQAPTRRCSCCRCPLGCLGTSTV